MIKINFLDLEKGKIELINKGDKAELIIYGEIIPKKEMYDDLETICPSEIKDVLDSIGDRSLDIYINSIGGNVFAGLAIYNMLKRHQGYKKVFIDGMAVSIASIIAMAGDEIIVPTNAYIMIHKASGSVSGDAKKLREIADKYEKMDETLADIYLTKAKKGITKDHFLEMMTKETWLSGDEIQNYFNVISAEENKMSACLINDVSNLFVLPAELVKLKNKFDKDKKDNINKQLEIEKIKLEIELEL